MLNAGTIVMALALDLVRTRQRLLVFVVCIAALCAPAGAAAAETPLTLAPGVELMRADFGLYNTDASGRPAFVPAKVVPHVPGQSYGWIIALRNERSTVSWREEFTLPSRPVSWGTADASWSREISADGRTAITRGEVSPRRGLLSNTWSVSEGDPKGRYVIRVYIEGALARVFEFEVR